MSQDGQQLSQGDALDEMAILNIFIKTIFEPRSPFSQSEQRVHDALRTSRNELMKASVFDLGDHLKDLSADSMKNTIIGVKQRLSAP